MSISGYLHQTAWRVYPRDSMANRRGGIWERCRTLIRSVSPTEITMQFQGKVHHGRRKTRLPLELARGLLSGSAPAEDYEKNLFANTFRCPQYTTQNLTTLTDKSWLGNFIYARSTKGKKSGQQVEEESHYYQKPGKRTVIMPAWEAQRTNWEGKRVYNVHSCDAEGNPVVMEKAYVEMWMHDSYLFNGAQSVKEMEWSN